MKKIFTILLCLPCVCIAQKKSQGYAQVGASFYVNKQLNHGGGGSIMVGNYVGTASSFGAGVDIVKFSGVKSFLSIFYADIRGYFGKGYSKPIPYLTITPGYSAYDYQHTRGGFYFGAGVGCLLQSGKKTAPFISVMYNRIPFTTTVLRTTRVRTNYDVGRISVGLRF